MTDDQKKKKKKRYHVVYSHDKAILLGLSRQWNIPLKKNSKEKIES